MMCPFVLDLYGVGMAVFFLVFLLFFLYLSICT